MRGQGEFSPEALKRLLPGFDPRTPGAAEHNGALADALDAYNRFYKLDMAREYPGLVQHVGWLNSGPYRLVAQLYQLRQPRGSAVVCHGYYDHVGLFGHLIRFLLDQGLSVLIFDLPGHGLSSGPRATISSFQEYVEALVDVVRSSHAVLPGPRYLIGQSMGGSVSMQYLLRDDPLAFEEVVLLAPLIRPAAWPLNRWVYEIARRTITARKRTISKNAENPEFIDLMKIDPLAPDTLPVQWVTAMVEWMSQFEQRTSLPFQPKIAQGLADRTVGWRYNLNVLERMCAPEVLDVLKIPAARHHLVNESPEIRAQLFDWLAQFLRGSAAPA